MPHWTRHPRRRRNCRSQAPRVHPLRHPDRRPRRRPGLPQRAWRLPGRRRTLRRRDARAPRSGLCGHSTQKREGGRAGGRSRPRRLSRALGRASREEEFAGPVLRTPRPRCVMMARYRQRWTMLRLLGILEQACPLEERRGPSE